MEMVIMAFIIGLFAGVFLGVMAMSILALGSEADDRAERMFWDLVDKENESDEADLL